MQGEHGKVLDEVSPERGSTRRRFIGGVAAAGAVHAGVRPLLAGAATTPPVCVPEARGIATGAIASTPDGRTLWTTDTRGATIAAHRASDLRRGRAIDVGGAPAGIAISPRGDLIVVTTAFYDRPRLALIDALTGEVDHVDVGPEPGHVAFTRSGRGAYVAGGGSHGTLTRVDLPSGRVHDAITLGAHPRGLVLHPDGKRALVALNGSGEVVVVDLVRRRITRHIRTGAFPAQLALSPDGKRAVVTHNGWRARAITPISVVHHRAGRQIRTGADPAGVAFTRSGAGVLVAASGAGTLTLLDARTHRRRRVARTGGAPRAVAVAGSRGIVADGRTGKLSALTLGVLR